MAKSNDLLISVIAVIVVHDFLTACVMAYYLHRARSGIGCSNIDGLVNRLLIYIVGTGGLTSVLGFIALIMFMEEQHTLHFSGILLVQVKIYANSILTSLNARKYNARALSGNFIDTFALMPIGHDLSQRYKESGVHRGNRQFMIKQQSSVS
ncbi:hypothetical protein SERLADRAFT_413437 [Serpula lacrymans var. lacrymans S7.9]|uniref:DUF6534 domain-containing protein n=1 Tax=Serpula lacrymans var. lacrymans (strain S7.9) TaxID=578457 RepID=F8NLH6_SERL9|nr:uncharacterized protein SERLADRAFT_413437 [Serpula lacrymans var. lacrymans S7.9]EGO28593.1 hypothetical protein SERLADRAFT_413437 [Serpula lacrymans var. lacrymans S7.9]